jgi:phosphoglycolate phosphatase
MRNQKVPIIFDLDGTLFDCKELTNRTFPLVLQKLKERYSGRITIRSFEHYDIFLGIVTEEIFSKILPDADANIVREAEQLLIEAEHDLIPKSGKLFQGAEQTLRELFDRGHPLFIASNGSKEYVHKVLEAFSLKDFFTGVYSAGEHGTKTKVDLVQTLVETHELEGKAVMVGDRHSDMEAGRENGLTTVGCPYGFGSKDEIEDADHRIEGIEGLVGVIDGLEEGGSV